MTFLHYEVATGPGDQIKAVLAGNAAWVRVMDVDLAGAGGGTVRAAIEVLQAAL
jgi:hypothetical protein